MSLNKEKCLPSIMNNKLIQIQVYKSKKQKNKMAVYKLYSMILGAFMILSVSLLLASEVCPTNCTCHDKGSRMYAMCKINSYTSIDSLYRSAHKISILQLNCRKDDRFTLERRMFHKFHNLVYIKFLNCTFDKIDKQAFEGMHFVEKLLIYNSVNLTLPQDLFHNIRGLQHLIISKSDLKIFSLDDFCLLNNIITINLSRNSITEIVEHSTSCPETSFSQLKQLLLNDNKIRVLRKGFAKKLKNIAKLTFHNNQIEEIHYGSLVDLPRLQFLDISQNYIKVLPDDLSTGCPELLELRISKNPITELPMTFNKLQNLRKFQAQNTLLSDISIIVNMSIEELNVQNCTLNTIPIPFCGKSSILRICVLKENKLQDIPAHAFQQCRHLENLDLSGNVIKSLNASSFNGLDKLMKLDLSRNNLSHVDNISENVIKSFNGIGKLINLQLSARYYMTDLIRLSFLNIAYNDIESFHSALIRLYNLKELHAQHNQLSTLNRNMFPQSIEEIYLSNNTIKNIEKGTFKDLIFLKTVDLRWNELFTLDSSSLQLTPSIHKITDILVFGNPLKCDCHLTKFKNNSVNKYPIFLDLAKTECLHDGSYYLQAVNSNSSDQQHFKCSYKRNSSFNLPYRCYINCQCCLTKKCVCQNKCAGSCLCTSRYDFTEFRVDCKNRNLTNGTSIPHNAILVDLSANELGYLTNAKFCGNATVEILYLNHSKITGIGARTFINFNRLKMLHLEHNDITILDSNRLLGLWNLNKLILNHNKIERILPGTFNVTPNLEILDLSHNNLRKIQSQTFNIDHLRSIHLFDNPWSCKCDDLNVLSTFLIHRIRQINSQNILCDQSDSPVIKYNLKYCRNKTMNRVDIKFIFICLAILVFLFGTATIVYGYRIEIQILLFVRFGWRILTKKNQLDEEDKEYDAFVSYHNSQDAFVVNEMLPCLEENTTPAYKLCVHFRDFLVGAPIVDNIIESIEKSKRTILLLTNEFLTSEWCRYEFQAAHLESLSNKMNNLIVVLLEDVDPDLLDGGLKLYMKTKTYLRYDDPRFWDKLRFALPGKKGESKL